MYAEKTKVFDSACCQALGTPEERVSNQQLEIQGLVQTSSLRINKKVWADQRESPKTSVGLDNEIIKSGHRLSAFWVPFLPNQKWNNLLLYWKKWVGSFFLKNLLKYLLSLSHG
jgi:hypothetical protein